MKPFSPSSRQQHAALFSLSKCHKYTFKRFAFLTLWCAMQQTKTSEKGKMNCFSKNYDKIYAQNIVKIETIKVVSSFVRLSLCKWFYLSLSFVLRFRAYQSIKFQLHWKKCQFFFIFSIAKYRSRHNLIIAWFEKLFVP